MHVLQGRPISQEFLRHILAVWTLGILPYTLVAQVGTFTIATLSLDTRFLLNSTAATSYFIPAINNQGQAGGVVVQTGTLSGVPYPTPKFVFSCTAEIFPNDAVCVGDQSQVVVWDLNDQGVLAGSIETAGEDGEFAARAAIFSRAFTNGYTLLNGSHQGVATKIDSVGQAVGVQMLNPPGYPQYVEAVFWHAGQSTSLGTLRSGDSSAAVSLNQRSEIVGFSEPGQWSSVFPVSWSTYRQAAHAFLWKNGNLMDLNNLIPSNSGWVLNLATDINDRGQIVGVGTKAGHPAGFLYERGTLMDLGLAGTNITVNSINEWGQIVGSANGHAFIWEKGVARDLNDFLPPGSEWVLEAALDINDLGQIVGVGSLPAVLDLFTVYGPRSTFQLTPTSLPANQFIPGLSQVLPDGSFQIGYLSASSTNVVLQSSSDLKAWVNLRTNENLQGTAFYQVTNTVDVDHQFFRLVHY